MIKSIVKQILSLEKKHQLFLILFKGRPFWPYYRMYFYYTITKEMQVLDAADAKIKFSMQYMWRMLSLFNLFKLLRTKEYFVLEHPRGNKDSKDIYSDEFVEVLGKNNCELFTFSQNGTIQKKKEVIVLDLLKIMSKVFSKIFYRFISAPNEFIHFINDFDIPKHKYVKQYKRYYIEYIFQYYFYFYLLKVKKVKKVILVVSYYNMPLVAAAKNLDIEVIELQHGVISRYHLGYHFPNVTEDFFPNTLLTFSSYWSNVAEYPKNLNIVALGNTYLSVILKESEKIKNTILVISQATIGKKLENFILENIQYLGQYQIYFKLHPNEYTLKESKYSNLKKHKNIKVITNEFNISELQYTCEYQIGIYSTAIYEGIEKSCKTILLDDTGIEYMEDIINKKMALVCQYNSKLITILKESKIPNNTIFFNSFDILKAKEIIYE